VIFFFCSDQHQTALAIETMTVLYQWCRFVEGASEAAILLQI